jgi:CheY-like chemotaxis protein
MEADDADAFAEILNQVIGSFNSVFKASLPNKTHLKLQVPKKFIPGIDQMSEQEPIPEDEYVLFRAQLNMDGQEMDRVDILVPCSLANLIDPPQAKPQPQEAPATEETSALQEAAGEVATPAGAGMLVMVLEDDAAEREHVKGYLTEAGLRVVDAPLKADLRELIATGDPSMAVIGVSETEDRELALCIKVNALRQEAPLPIIMCAPNWTRSGVLKAIKYGARDIIIKPYDRQELMSKVAKVLEAA